MRQAEAEAEEERKRKAAAVRGSLKVRPPAYPLLTGLLILSVW